VKVAFASYVLQVAMLSLLCISDNGQRDQDPAFVYYEYDGYISKLNVSSKEKTPAGSRTIDH